MQYSKSRVDKAGFEFISNAVGEIDPETGQVISAWRAAHALPLGDIVQAIGGVAKSAGVGVSVAQRLKRLPSIKSKLHNSGTKYRLTQLQDIGGCRFVVETMQDLLSLATALKDWRSEYVVAASVDYVGRPRNSGYRGCHIVYRVPSTVYGTLLVEVQLRTSVQHVWATAVETTGVFLNQDFKSEKGDGDWLRFFALVSTMFAVYENSPPVPGTHNDVNSCLNELLHLSYKINAMGKIKGMHTIHKILGEPEADAYYYLLGLKWAESNMSLRTFRKDQLDDAIMSYKNYEELVAESPGVDVVLVNVDSMKELASLYPNYFLDIGQFYVAVHDLLGLARNMNAAID